MSSKVLVTMSKETFLEIERLSKLKNRSKSKVLLDSFVQQLEYQKDENIEERIINLETKLNQILEVVQKNQMKNWKKILEIYQVLKHFFAVIGGVEVAKEHVKSAELKVINEVRGG